MDSRQIFGYSFPGIEVSRENIPAHTLPHSGWTLGHTKFESRCSPDSPLSTHCDYDTFSTTLSNSQEHYSSTTENISGISPSHNFSLEIDSSFQRSPSNLPEIHLVGDSSENFTTYSMRNALQKLESDLMGPDTDEASTPSSAFDEIQRPETLKQRSRAWHVPGSHQENPLMVPHQPHNIAGHQMAIVRKGLLLKRGMADFEKLNSRGKECQSPYSGGPFSVWCIHNLLVLERSFGSNIVRALSLITMAPKERDRLKRNSKMRTGYTSLTSRLTGTAMGLALIQALAQGRVAHPCADHCIDDPILKLCPRGWITGHWEATSCNF
ncbi:LOW QUALITY PROTEIN: chitin-inducible gibberellin-responsive protein 1-like protein isoform X1 [Cinnamomum micranthum f. kanehirae]|uniref:Chitin-inducible gibberellin-responsive protein 1-like protein isoform X1 n=1 Tax=Cinnamomum micranthum f. kanehirae TaxID=337451 RepID=A0A3S4Q0H0_9MAGN|nr:LOW QUALITY PROTEIN: chitin-inducible gibberellin-responsive protein 1-like protein isoform X1 [Cinnamomum micranthum f. kanehirae]